jgi:DNA invertase Pin-like site-specific DNA recombinase
LSSLIGLFNELHRRGIESRSLSDNIDTSQAAGVHGAVAEMAHDLIRERTNAGLAAARARGREGSRRPSKSRMYEPLWRSAGLSGCRRNVSCAAGDDLSCVAAR